MHEHFWYCLFNINTIKNSSYIASNNRQGFEKYAGEKENDKYILQDLQIIDMDLKNIPEKK